MKQAIFSHFPGVFECAAHRVGKMGHNATATLCNGFYGILQESPTLFFQNQFSFGGIYE
jgi:hypothetical protein